MNGRRYIDELRTAVRAVQEAAALCQAVRDGIPPDALTKEDRSPVTVADFGSQALICRTLREVFPDDLIMAEEDSSALRQPDNRGLLDETVSHVADVTGGADADQVCAWIDAGNLSGQRDRFWTLDPIDGTKGFLRGDQYAIALALVEDGEVQVGALACPHLPKRWGRDSERGWIYAAVRGQGASRWPLGEAEAQATLVDLHVSVERDPSKSRFCESFVSSHSSHDVAEAAAQRLGIREESLRLDSQAKYAIVARGEAEIYLRLPRPGSSYTERIWDHAAGCLVVEEAGGRVTDMNGQPLSFRHGRLLSQNEGVVATNGLFHEAVLEALETVGSSTA